MVLLSAGWAGSIGLLPAEYQIPPLLFHHQPIGVQGEHLFALAGVWDLCIIVFADLFELGIQK